MVRGPQQPTAPLHDDRGALASEATAGTGRASTRLSSLVVGLCATGKRGGTVGSRSQDGLSW